MPSHDAIDRSSYCRVLVRRAHLCCTGAAWLAQHPPTIRAARMAATCRLQGARRCRWRRCIVHLVERKPLLLPAPRTADHQASGSARYVYDRTTGQPTTHDHSATVHQPAKCGVARVPCLPTDCAAAMSILCTLTTTWDWCIGRIPMPAVRVARTRPKHGRHIWHRHPSSSRRYCMACSSLTQHGAAPTIVSRATSPPAGSVQEATRLLRHHPWTNAALRSRLKRLLLAAVGGLSRRCLRWTWQLQATT
jgi:hypothetical protein